MSSTTNIPPSGANTSTEGGGRSYFEQQREILLKEIGTSFEHVLSNINKLNRSLEGVIAVGNEFSSVEALWSQFENVMGREGGEGDGNGNGNSAGGQQSQHQQQQQQQQQGNGEGDGQLSGQEDRRSGQQQREEEEEEEGISFEGGGSSEDETRSGRGLRR